MSDAAAVSGWYEIAVGVWWAAVFHIYKYERGDWYEGTWTERERRQFMLRFRAAAHVSPSIIIPGEVRS